jgi:hypothetical protein
MRRPLLGTAGVVALALGSAGILFACDRDSLYRETSFSQNVYDAYEECSDSEVKFVTEKHGLQMAFEPCGSNNFTQFAWSPDGLFLYFALPMSAHIMNGEDKTITALPTEVPISDVAWLSNELLVLPLGASAGSEAQRLILFDRVQASLHTLELRVTDPRDLQSLGARDQVYFTAESGGVRSVYLADFTTGEVSKAFEWMTGSVESFTFEPEQGVVVTGAGGTVVVTQVDGTELHRFDNAARGVMHPDGRYIALEAFAERISPFDQRRWDELTPEQREREERRMEEWLTKQPEWVPKDVHPPVLDFYDSQTQERYRLGYMYGDRFQWYPAKYYGSFVLWGMEGKELNRNVVLGQLAERLRMASIGEYALGVEIVGAEVEPAPEGADAAPEGTDAAPAAADTPPVE